MRIGKLIPIYSVLLSGGLIFGENTVSFTSAVNALIEKNLLGKAFDNEIKGLDTLRYNAKQFLDPKVSTSADIAGFKEYGLGIEQTFERGIKHNTRKELVEKKIELKKLEQGRIGYTIHGEASRRYIPVLFNLQKLQLVDSMVDESYVLDTMLQRYVDAGAIRYTDVLKSKLDREKLRMQRLDLSQHAERTRAYFCSLSPADSALLMSVDAVINKDFHLPDIMQIATILEKNYNYEIVTAECKIIDTEKKLVNAEAKKDLTFGLEFARNRIDRENILTAEFSVELPLFRNVEREQSDLEYQKQAALLRHRNDVTETLGEIRDIYSQISVFEQKNEMIRDTIIPSLVNQYNSYMSIYKEGKGSFRDISEIRMELLTYKMELLDNEMNTALLVIDAAVKSGIKPEVLK